MSYTLDSVVQLLNQALVELRVCHDDNKALKEQLSQLQVQVSAVQNAAPKSRGTKTAASSHVGVANAVPKSAFPPNTVVWLRAKCAADPNYLVPILGQGNFNNFVKKFEDAGDLKGLEGSARDSKIGERIWKYLGELSEIEGQSKNKDFANHTLEFLRKSWKAEKTAFEAANPTSVAPAATTSGTIVPDTPVMTSPVVPQLDTGLTQPLVQQLTMNLPLNLGR